MDRTGSSKKEITRENIVKAASRALRRRGSAGVGVAEVMQEAGLTHGGFYAHFESKNALIAEAADNAAGDTLTRLGKAIRLRGENEDSLATLLESYLSEQHLAAPERGCLLASLGSDLQRESPEVRRVATERIKEMIDLIQRQLPGWERSTDKGRAMAILSGMVGAMIVARAVDEPEFASAILGAARDLLSAESGTRK